MLIEWKQDMAEQVQGVPAPPPLPSASAQAGQQPQQQKDHQAPPTQQGKQIVH